MNNNSSPSNEQPSSPKPSRKLEEWVAVIVAFLSLGSILGWVMLRDRVGFSLKSAEILLGSTQSSESLERLLEGSSERSSEPLLEGSSEPLLEPSKLIGVKPIDEVEDEVEEEVEQESSTKDEESAQIEETSSSEEVVASREPEESPSESALPAVAISATGELISMPSSLTPSVPSTTGSSTTGTPSAPLTTGSSPTSKPEGFSDVADDYWAKPAIETMVSRNILNGFPDGSFQPNVPVTRAELAVQLQKVFAQKAKKDGVSYKDIPTSSTTAEAIDEVSKSGFLSGYPGEVFRPEQRVPRVQVLVAIVSGLNLELPDNPENIITEYKDAADIPNWAIPKVAAASQNGLIINYPDRQLLNPNEPATRAEVSVMIHQALAIKGEVEPLSNP